MWDTLGYPRWQLNLLHNTCRALSYFRIKEYVVLDAGFLSSSVRMSWKIICVQSETKGY